MEIPSSSEFTWQNMMLPPPSRTFQDREDLISYVRDFGVSQGYIVTIRKSKKDRSVVLGCDRGGTYRNRRNGEEMKRKREASSRLINCPFQAIGKKDDDVWVLTVRNGEHNHEPLKDISEHRYSRRLTEEEVEQIKLMNEAGAKPRQMLEALKQSNPEFHSTPRHLYNVKAKIRQGLSEKSFKYWRPNLSAAVGAPTVRSVKVTNYIGGKFLESQACEVIDVINPATQEVGSQVPMTTFEEFKAAVDAAKQAFPPWKNTPVYTRQRVMFKLQELIRRDIDKISMNLTKEQGKTLISSKADVLYGIELVERACGMATLLAGKYVPNAANGIDTLCTREPIGVCAGICLSNLPTMIPLWMFPVAVTCGNTFILKPSEKNPGVSMMVAALAAEAGLPDGVLNIVHGNHEIARNICGDEDIKAVSLVSPNTVGMDLYARAAVRGKRVQSNIEVKNHIIIMPDASADAALDAVIEYGFGASGTQRFISPCVAVFVGSSSQWEQKLVERAKELKVNAGVEPGTDIGPVISKEAKDRMCRLVQSGICSGARLVLDGRQIVVQRYGEGNFLGPTIMCDVTTSMDCYKEEVDGPVLLCMQAGNLDEAISIVNSSKLGRGASIFTSSCATARKFQNEVETGLVGINVPVSLSLPLSTFSCSSVAGDLDFCGNADVHFYTQSKTVVQRWKELPRGRVPPSHPHPPTFEIETCSPGTSPVQCCGSERDSFGGMGSKTTPSALPELPSDDFPMALGSPLASSSAPQPVPMGLEGATTLPSTSLMHQEQSRMMHSATPVDSTNQHASTSTPSLSSDGIWSENMEAMNDRSPPTTERFYLPTMSRDENMAMLSRRHDGPPFSERLHLPVSDGMRLTRLNGDASARLDSAAVSRCTEIYSASAARWNVEASSNRNSTLSTSQGMYVQTPNSPAVEDHREGVL
ncbi:methylmalonate-semialdehyde dehydrogenase [acylating], mitochondrial-like isoform X2 [Salvia miltiorrhiza]|uniref:methylmalonate-semialdehyde dehydrogenase [acylating], mitochondrial-like isoform X2 n=1 Tax=Salvia miltiorrhiza TaxID=226208 RepID=UPI0025ABEC02|nr:methylmalonate-semialdehyde dehydrogenase [acylating], mitochondrial-like isoform X2 [Salvia miltiorrhiza]